MSSRSFMLLIIFLVAKYGSVVGGLSSAIVPEGLKRKIPVCMFTVSGQQCMVCSRKEAC